MDNTLKDDMLKMRKMDKKLGVKNAFPAEGVEPDILLAHIALRAMQYVSQFTMTRDAAFLKSLEDHRGLVTIYQAKKKRGAIVSINYEKPVAAYNGRMIYIKEYDGNMEVTDQIHMKSK